MNENLSQDEIETLLEGVDSGAVNTTPDALMDGEAVPYDFGNQDRVVSGHMPMFDMVYDRFLRYMRSSMFNMLRRTTEVSLVNVSMHDFQEFARSLSSPTNINLISIKPLRGTGLFVMEPGLVYTTVDNFFGGDGRTQAIAESREFTPTEVRIIQLLLKRAFADLQKAWEPVIQLEFNHLGSETNPQFVNVINSTEVVVVSTFRMELNGSSGQFHIVMPFAMLEPIRDLLEAGSKNDQENVDPRWRRALQDEMKSATVKINSYMGHTKLSLGEILNLNPGDIIPVKLAELVTVRAAKIPIFRGALGISNGKHAIRYVEQIPRPDYSHD